ncbi:MOSC domain-containing protein [Microbulbifer sp. A4B17]|nr:MOSC domain-containing protein [Microbulbifer sp. A4B17]
MKLVSINVSKKQIAEYKGKPVSTGIFKKPLQGKVYVGKRNINGDEQADLKHHGGIDMAVYAFSYDHYPYWEKLLGRNDLKYGIFGENLTVKGLVEEKTFIGDQFRIGSSILEVSQPRIPCFKLAMALDDDSAPKLFTSSFNTGVYFRVIEEGHITKDDLFKKIMQPPNSVSVRSLFRAMYDKAYIEAGQVLEVASQLTTLSQEWREKAKSRLIRLK